MLQNTFSFKAQQLDKIGSKNPLKISGGLSFNQTMYQAWNKEASRDPYRYILSGNINFDLYGFSMPLSFNYSNQQFNYTQPFNQFSLSPTYKWMQFQIGYGSISFSPYTLSGHTFLGGAINGSPNERWDFSVMYGRLREETKSNQETGNPALLRRMGMGFQTNYTHVSGSLGISFFHAEDDHYSIPYDSLGNTISPEENVAFSLNFDQRIIENLSIHNELGVSILTSNSRAKKVKNSNFLNWIMPSRTSTATYLAFNSSLSYTIKGWNIGLNYERIGPEYRTLGSYYANNDLETFSTNLSGSLFKSQLQFGGNFGLQRDNLSGEKLSEMANYNYALNLSYQVSKTFNCTINYSNFRSFTVIRNQFEDINALDPHTPIDTLNYTQLTDAANVGLNYRISNNKVITQNFSLNLNYQKTADQQTDSLQQWNNSQFFNASFNWSWANKNHDVRMGLGVNANKSIPSPEVKPTMTIGPSFLLSKSIMDKKVKLKSNFSMNQSRLDDTIQSTIYSWRIGANTSLKKVHALNMSAVFINRGGNSNVKNRVSEITVSLSYNYSFSSNTKNNNQ